MNAVISGQSGVAVLVDGSRLASVHAGSDAAPVDRSPGEVRFLLGDARDLEFLENVAPEEARRRLEVATSYYDALHLALILLDGELAHDTRRTAAEDLDELLAEDGLTSFVESVLHSRPLPRGGDLLGALSACTGWMLRARAFLERLEALQTVIGEVHGAWERIPDSRFGSAEDRQHALSVAVKEGLFRGLVAARASGAPVESFLNIAAMNSSFRRIESSRDILLAWIGDFQGLGKEGRIPDSWSSYAAEISTPPVFVVPVGAQEVVQGNMVMARAASAEIIERVRPRMMQVLGRYRVPAADAEDLMQDAMIAAIHKWDEIQNPEAWLLATLRNRCVVYWRKRRNTLYNSVDTAILELLAEPIAAPDERAELVSDLSNLLEELPQRCRQLLRLRYGLGLDTSEVAQTLGHHPSSMRKVARRCLAALTYQMLSRGFITPDNS